MKCAVLGLSLYGLLAGAQSVAWAEGSASPAAAPTSSALSASKYAPADHPRATRLFLAQDYVRKHPAPDFWAMIPYYTAQFNDKACSVASVNMVVNAARAPLKLGPSDELATQAALLKKVAHPRWADAVGEKGQGESLDELASLLQESLEAYGLKKVTVEIVHVTDASPAMHHKLHSTLINNEKSADDFIVANFIQGEFTGDPEGAVGHIAPIGAYDSAKKSVLMMDPDRQWYEPYWVSEETLLKGMNTEDKGARKYRGYVWVKFKR